MNLKVVSKFNLQFQGELQNRFGFDLKTFINSIALLTPEESHRINPYLFSQRFNIAPDIAVELFIQGAHLRLFEIIWNQLCPGCGGAEYSVPRIQDLKPSGTHCTICDLDIESNLDEQIEVYFQLSSEMIPKPWDVNQNPETFRSFFFSPNFVRSPELTTYSKERLVKISILAPGESVTLPFKPQTNAKLYRALSVKNHSQALLKVKPGGKTKIQLNLGVDGFAPQEAEISDQEVDLKITNQTSEKFPLTLIKTDFDILHSIIKQYPNQQKQFFTGRDLINCQTFRELFKFPELPKDFFMPTKSISVLFTDLQGSTELYSQLGDIHAYQKVRNHLDELISKARKHSGAVVKTMGDSVMATFSKPELALKAAFDILGGFSHSEINLQPKPLVRLGIHEGPALVVNSESQLDFFGQTINLTARIMEHVKAGEIGVSETFFSKPEIQLLLKSQALQNTSQICRFKGIESPCQIHVIHALSSAFKQVS
ncbi:MAG: DUF5939 domain-containing protein [Deltaproteobacteria bacterium]